MPVAGGWGLVTHLGDEVLKAGDDVGALKLLVVAKAAGDHDHSDEGQRQVQLGEAERGGEWPGAGSSLPEATACFLVPLVISSRVTAMVFPSLLGSLRHYFL